MEKKKNRVLEIITKEYKFENVLLLILGTSLALMAIYLLTPENPVTIQPGKLWLIGDVLYRYQQIFAWVLLVIGVGAIFLVAIPIFRPSKEEFKRISWPSKETMVEHSIKVFTFIFILSLVFMLYEVVLTEVVDLIDSIQL